MRIIRDCGVSGHMQPGRRSPRPAPTGSDRIRGILSCHFDIPGRQGTQPGPQGRSEAGPGCRFVLTRADPCSVRAASRPVGLVKHPISTNLSASPTVHVDLAYSRAFTVEAAPQNLRACRAGTEPRARPVQYPHDRRAAAASGAVERRGTLSIAQKETRWIAAYTNCGSW